MKKYNNSNAMNKYSNYSHMKNNKNYNSMENNNNIMSYNKNDNDKYYFNNLKVSKVCGIKNKENNCYLNSGLQILASCNELVDLINHCHYYLKNKTILTELEDAFNALLNNKNYDPTNFINYFCSLNVNFIRGSQCCSQDFIRTLIRNIN